MYHWSCCISISSRGVDGLSIPPPSAAAEPRARLLLDLEARCCFSDGTAITRAGELSEYRITLCFLPVLYLRYRHTALTLDQSGFAFGRGSSPAEGPSVSAVAGEAMAATGDYEPTPLSVQVRGMRTSGDAQARIQGNMLCSPSTR